MTVAAMNGVELNTHELAWAAGFFDGEGSTYFTGYERGSNRYTRGYKLGLSISQKEYEPIKRFSNIIGYGEPKLERNGKGYIYKILVGRFEHVQYIMCKLWKYLSYIKKEQYKNAVKQYLAICWKPKFDNISISKREYDKIRRCYGSYVMMVKIKAYENTKNYNKNETIFVNPFTESKSI